MYTNDLNSAYAYECERRNDERRAASESLRLRELGRKSKASLPSLKAVLGILVVLVVVIRAF